MLAAGCDSGTEDSACLLAGGRKEINLKYRKWKISLWKEKLFADIQAEIMNVIENKGALRPLSLEESRQVRQRPLPGYYQEQLFQVVLPIYVLNDSPQNWFMKWQKNGQRIVMAAIKIGPCVFFLLDQ